MSNVAQFGPVNAERKKESAERRRQFLNNFAHEPERTITSHLEEIGVGYATYAAWRQKFPDFVNEITTIKAKNKLTIRANENGEVIEPFKGNFVEKRMHYFGYDTPWFQQKTVDAYGKARGGDIVLVLMPPEHGKTSLTEDDLSITIAENPSALITVISEGLNMARKISQRLMKRMSTNGPSPEFLRDYGPFEPQIGEAGRSNPWGVDAWSVYKSGLFDTRDYTMAIGGWNSAIAGTRATRLHIDDMQSHRSADSTEKMIGRMRQDMFSRPGQTGHTTMNGTSVRDDDIYYVLDSEFGGEDFYTKIEFPALVVDHLTGELVPLWEFNPDTGMGHTLESLERMRKVVGEDAWWRNYMQNPRTQKFVVFEETDQCYNTMRSIGMRRDQIPGVTNGDCWITLDPSIGGINCAMAMHAQKDKLMILDVQEDTDLPRNSAIAQRLDDLCKRVSAAGWSPSMLIIEAMAFQKGLMQDEFILDVAKRWGMRLESHMTGINKYDENIGVPSMASSVQAGSVDLPYANQYDQAVSEQITAQMKAWKPVRDGKSGKLKFQRGNKLRQDQLMALWFGWIWWTELRGNTTVSQASEAFNMGGLPFAMTGSGLLVPT